MSASPASKRMKGTGRVAFMAQLADITAERDAGWPLKAIYEAHRERLGISYAQFTRYVDRIVRRAQHGESADSAQPALPLSSVPAPTPRAHPVPTAEPPAEGDTYAGHRPARTFHHDPLEGPDDRRRLLGED